MASVSGRRRVPANFFPAAAQRFTFAVVAVSSCILAGCGMYSPEPFVVNVATTTVATGSGVVYPVNQGRQICNPSVAPGGIYAGCMLWLNFGGELNVKVPASMDGYRADRANVRQHDRLTISDTANEVRWFAMRSELSVEGQLQDPEWSTDENHVICLGDRADKNVWSCYVTRLSDKAVLRISEDNMDEVSTPHLWIGTPDSAADTVHDAAAEYSGSRGGFADIASVKSYFGTDSVKVVYARKNEGLALYYIDYTSSDASPIKLAKPAGRESWDIESPLISPDGNWVVYNCNGQGLREAYLQRLGSGTTPVEVGKKATDPHWWVHPVFKTTSLVYAVLKGDYFTKEEYTDASLETGGILGATYRQEVRIATGKLPAHAASEFSGNPVLLVNMPYKGGLSGNGKFLCTGYGGGFILSLF